MAWLAIACCVKVWRYEPSRWHRRCLGVAVGVEVAAADTAGQDPNPAGAEHRHGGHRHGPGSPGAVT